MPSTDTTPEAEAVYRASYESLTGAERMERASEMAEEVKEITLAGIRHRNPNFDEREVHREWLRILHGDELAELLG